MISYFLRDGKGKGNQQIFLCMKGFFLPICEKTVSLLPPGKQ